MTNKSLDTLVEDIYQALDRGVEVSPEQAKAFGSDMSEFIVERLSPKSREVNNDTKLRMSNLGSKCQRQLWYKVNKPDKAEKILPFVRLKFLYGDIVEHLVLFLARLAGHQVKGEQGELEIEGVKGHRDAIIDGVVIDVKSANSRGMDKFKYHALDNDDPFGYLDQLGAYVEASTDAETQDKGAFLAVDKELGHLVLDTYTYRDKGKYAELTKKLKEMLALVEPPKRAFQPEPEGKSGNMKLPTPCAYCSFKKTCHPGVRTFIYSNGPKYLTTVVKLPEVNEV